MTKSETAWKAGERGGGGKEATHQIGEEGTNEGGRLKNGEHTRNEGGIVHNCNIRLKTNIGELGLGSHVDGEVFVLF